MDIKVNVIPSLNDLEVIINTPKEDDNVNNIVDFLNGFNNISKISCKKNNEIYLIDIKEVIYFYSYNGSNFLKTKEGDFKVNSTLYNLESALPKYDFIRISNSHIANINQIKCFDTGLVGQLIVRFNHGLFEYVSQRKTSTIMKFIKERRKFYGKI